MVALEIAIRKRSVNPIGKDFKMRLVEWVWDLHRKGNLLLAVDEKLVMEFDAKQVECLMIVRLWCVHPDPSLRPSTRQAISSLNF